MENEQTNSTLNENIGEGVQAEEACDQTPSTTSSDSELNPETEDSEEEPVQFESEYFESYAEYGARQLYFLLANTFDWIYDTANNILASEQCKMLGLNLLWTASKLCVYTERLGANLYNSNNYIRDAVDLFSRVKCAVNNLTLNVRTETTRKNWVHVCRVAQKSDKNFAYYELYDIFNDDITAISCEASLLNTYDSILNATNEYIDTCIIMKHSNRYYVSLCSHDMSKPIVPSPLDMIMNTPISVSYNHPAISESIELTIPIEMYCVGNNLFSAAFVRRCLEYQQLPFVFDDRYTLTIIDTNVTIHTISSTEYITVTADGIEKKATNRVVVIEKKWYVSDSDGAEEDDYDDEDEDEDEDEDDDDENEDGDADDEAENDDEEPDQDMKAAVINEASPTEAIITKSACDNTPCLDKNVGDEKRAAVFGLNSKDASRRSLDTKETDDGYEAVFN
jgi:hypothetical protein